MGSVAIIGAGVIGMATARALQRDGHRITVFDPEPPGSGCSFGNAGHIAIDHIRPMARPDVLLSLPKLLLDPLGPLCLKPAGLPLLLPWMLRFAAAAQPKRVAAGTAALAGLLAQADAAWTAEIEASGLAMLFRRKGSLIVYEQDPTEGAAEARILAAHGVRVDMLSAKETASRVPGLAVPVTGGRFHPDAYHTVDPYELVLTLAQRLAAEGGKIERAAVTGFDLADRVIRAVHVGGSRLSFDHVVLAAGAGAGALAAQLGARAPLARERGYHLMLKPNALQLDLPVTFAERGFVATPMSAGIRLAGTVELGVGKTPDWRRAEILFSHAGRLFGRNSLTGTTRWYGDRPTLPDYLPMIGPAPRARNAVLALGHQHLGLTLAAVTGGLVADIIANRFSTLPLMPFRTDRFGTT